MKISVTRSRLINIGNFENVGISTTIEDIVNIEEGVVDKLNELTKIATDYIKNEVVKIKGKMK